MSKFFWYNFIIGFLLLLFSLETTPLISIYGEVPDLILVFLVFIALRKGPMTGILLGFILGLFIDFFSGQLLGSQAFIKMTIGFFVGMIGSRLIVYSFQTEMLVVFLASIIHFCIFYIELLIFSNASYRFNFGGILIHLFYTVVLSPIIILGLKFIERKTFERF